MKDRVVFGVMSLFPPLVFFGLLVFFVPLYLGKLDARTAIVVLTAPWNVGFIPLVIFALPAAVPGGILSLAITIGGIIHIVRKKKKGGEFGYYLLFTIIAAIPLLFILYKFLQSIY